MAQTRVATSAQNPASRVALARDSNVVIDIVRKMREVGPAGLQIIADFDRTLTRCRSPDGREVASAFGIVGQYPGLPEQYRQEIAAVKGKYYPIEIDPHMTKEEKIPHMETWWKLASEALVKVAPRRGQIRDMVRAANVVFREATDVLVAESDKFGAPLLVFSAGISDVIEECFREHKLLHSNMHVIANRLKFDGEGDEAVVSDFVGPLIHVFNKSEASVTQSNHNEWVREVSKRKSILLLGDSLGDVHMADGVTGALVLRVAMLHPGEGLSRVPNHNHQYDEAGMIKENRVIEDYGSHYHVLVPDDGSLDLPLLILRIIAAPSDAEAEDRIRDLKDLLIQI